jgi:hypothetical protein
MMAMTTSHEAMDHHVVEDERPLLVILEAEGWLEGLNPEQQFSKGKKHLPSDAMSCLLDRCFGSQLGAQLASCFESAPTLHQFFAAEKQTSCLGSNMIN